MGDFIDSGHPALLRQPNWVIQSGSQDRTDQLLLTPNLYGIKAWEWIKPGYDAYLDKNQEKSYRLWKEVLDEHQNEILLLRAINQYAPSLLKMSKPRTRGISFKYRIAIILPGELRCMNQSKEFLRELSKKADIFICTSERFKEESTMIKSRVKFISQEPLLPVGAMQQWHKLSEALGMVRMHERKIGKRYTHILKLRTDFHHAKPSKLLKELIAADGLICSSDKVFGGRRELMLLFDGFYAAIKSIFNDREQSYWPINTQTILKSDDSSKWYGMFFPKTLVGEPKGVEYLRQILKEGGSHLANELLTWRVGTNFSTDDYVRFFKGNSRFASEICFARFLNFNAIPTHNCPGLTGFLRSDRLAL